MRELCLCFPNVALALHKYLPPLHSLIQLMQQSSKLVELWCVLEAIFFIFLKLHMRYLQLRDPLEASLSSAPFMKPHQRAILWERMMDVEKNDPAAMISGWFFDQDILKISSYDIREFITWSMFEGRNQEHLTTQELEQLESFVKDLEDRISIHWYGVHEVVEGGELNAEVDNTIPALPVPRKSKVFWPIYCGRVDEHHSLPNFVQFHCSFPIS